MNSAATSPQEKIIEVTIQRLLPGGVGLAHAEGLTIFVSLAAPADVVRIEIERVRGKVGFATIKEIVKPSPVRVEPPCPYFGRCGGCDFQQLDYAAQLQAKVEIIRDCLHRIARIEPPLEIEIHPSPTEWHYRSRASWQFDPKEGRLGYFERGSHRVCDVEYCAILAPQLQQALEGLRAQLKDGSIPAEVRQIEAAAGNEGVSVSPSVANFDTQEISRTFANETYYFSARAFFQVNQPLAESLIAKAIGDIDGDLAIDLYSGAGLFTLPLARRFQRVISVEANPTAAGFAKRNLQRAALPNAKVVTARVDEWLRHNSSLPGSVDLLVLDPPRSGVEEDVIAGIITIRPRRISYASCDPATLARDLKKLVAGGYLLDSLAAFDMFPQTHHVETLAVLTSGDPST